ncbi:MAG: rod-binding protein [Pseudomonadota bacterium]
MEFLLPKIPVSPNATPTASGTKPPADDVVRDAQMRQLAQKFEATFLAEMLKYSGLGAQRGTFHGGAGEAGFSGFLTMEYAEQIADRGSLGIADKIYTSLKERSGQ